jgi:hypothetical protein
LGVVLGVIFALSLEAAVGGLFSRAGSLRL